MQGWVVLPSTGLERPMPTGKKSARSSSKKEEKAGAKSARTSEVVRSGGSKPKKAASEDSAPAQPKKPATKSGGAKRTKRIEEMRTLLLERREALIKEMWQNLKYQSSPPASKGDSSDHAADAVDSDTAMHLAESGSSEVAQINAALEHTENGTYGLCDTCSEQIPWSRLKALPYATLCVKCKELEELKGGDGQGAAGWSAVDEFEDLGAE